MTPEIRSHRILAAIRAVAKLQSDLVKTDRQLRDAESAELSDATKAYREVLRDADERREQLTPEESHEILPEALDGLATRDAIHEANTAARKARAAERKRVDGALAELHKPAQGDGDQPSLPGLDGDEQGQTDAATGLGWFTAECRAVVYTALLHSDGDLDPAQVELLADLASLGLEQIDFVLDAAEAIDEGSESLDGDQIAELDAELDAGSQTRNHASLPI